PAVTNLSAEAFFANRKLLRQIRRDTNLVEEINSAGFLRHAQQERGKGVEVIAGRPAQQLGGPLGKMEAARIRHIAVARHLILQLIGLLQIGLKTGAKVVGTLLPVDARIVVSFRVAISL